MQYFGGFTVAINDGGWGGLFLVLCFLQFTIFKKGNGTLWAIFVPAIKPIQLDLGQFVFVYENKIIHIWPNFCYYNKLLFCGITLLIAHVFFLQSLKKFHEAST